MLISNKVYLEALEQLITRYSRLPWYQRLWFNLWSYRLARALSAINSQNPSIAQMQNLLRTSEESWFFSSIFGLLEQFRYAVLGEPEEEPQIEDNPTCEEQQKEPFPHPKKIANKPFPFEHLPDALVRTIANNLTLQGLSLFARTAQKYNSLSRPIIEVQKFLGHVIRAEYDTVEWMLKKDSSLLIRQGVITDCSGRVFHNISGFEYALWALDKHMWSRMLQCISQKEQSKIKTEVISQYEKLKEKGITYTFNNQKITEKHFDFANTILKEYQKTMHLLQIRLPALNWDKEDQQWIEGVGGAQGLFPMHVVYEYCNDAPFNATSNFIIQPVPKDEFYHGTFQSYIKWFNSQFKIGRECAVVRLDDYRVVVRLGSPMGQTEFLNDMEGMKKLCEIRTQDFIRLETKLETLLEDSPSIIPRV